MVQQFQQPKGAPHQSRVKAENRYPVYDLNDSIAVARTIRDQGGGATDLPHLASYLGYSTTKSGAFITRIAAARLFGLIENRERFVAPTALAHKIMMPERPGDEDVMARFDAFLNVPLYRNLYERYKPTQLPPEMGLRNAMETHYGIPRGRTQLVYRVLMDSAEQAGLFEARAGARTHFVAPLARQSEIEASSAEWENPEARLEQQPPVMQTPAPPADPIERLRQVLVEKVREVPATDMETIREYIKEIKELGDRKGDGNEE